MKTIKERAQFILQQWNANLDDVGHDMASLLQELVDAPAPSVLGNLNKLTLSNMRKKLSLPEHCAERHILCAIDDLLEAAPPPPKLSDERILEIWANNSDRPVMMGKARIIAQARAIEREILGE